MWLPLQTLRPGIGSIAAATLLIGMLGSFEPTERYDTRVWITGNPHLEMRDVASWISSSEFKDDFVLLTDMGWTASYLAMHWPEIADRRAIVSDWVEDPWVREQAVDRAPGLLVTRAADLRQRARVEEALNWQINRAALVYEHGGVEVYDLERARPAHLEVTAQSASTGSLGDRGNQSPVDRPHAAPYESASWTVTSAPPREYRRSCEPHPGRFHRSPPKRTR
ncbi:MAG: hypothetical protein P8R42_05115 [Candidatus Binatia bacterium]|nr:hypothetical protein [Candidatus Binatia bacterium]